MYPGWSCDVSFAVDCDMPRLLNPSTKNHTVISVLD